MHVQANWISLFSNKLELEIPSVWRKTLSFHETYYEWWNQNICWKIIWTKVTSHSQHIWHYSKNSSGISGRLLLKWAKITDLSGYVFKSLMDLKVRSADCCCSHSLFLSLPPPSLFFFLDKKLWSHWLWIKCEWYCDQHMKNTVIKMFKLP